jgi:hypothetical protein
MPRLPLLGLLVALIVLSACGAAEQQARADAPQTPPPPMTFAFEPATATPPP